MAEIDAAPGKGSGPTVPERIARQRSGWLRLRTQLARYTAAAAPWLFLWVTAAAQVGSNPFKKEGGARFKGAPPDPEAEAQAAEAAADYYFGIHVNTIFFVPAALVAIIWFTVGGGRKAKVSRE